VTKVRLQWLIQLGFGTWTEAGAGYGYGAEAEAEAMTVRHHQDFNFDFALAGDKCASSVLADPSATQAN